MGKKLLNFSPFKWPHHPSQSLPACLPPSAAALTEQPLTKPSVREGASSSSSPVCCRTRSSVVVVAASEAGPLKTWGISVSRSASSSPSLPPHRTPDSFASTSVRLACHLVSPPTRFLLFLATGQGRFHAHTLHEHAHMTLHTNASPIQLACSLLLRPARQRRRHAPRSGRWTDQ